MMNLKNYKGVLPSPEDKRDWHIDRCMDIPAGSINFPKKFKVSWLPEIRDQLYTQSCTAFVVALIMSCIWHKLYGEDKVFSTGYSYGNRRETEHKGEGQFPRAVAKTITEYGDVFANIWDNNLEVPKAIDVFEEDYEKICSFAKKLIKGYVRLTIHDAEEAKSFLMKYDVPLFASTKIKHINPLGQSNALHAIACTGWDGKYFTFQNSWGKNDCPHPKIELENLEEIWGFIPMEKKKFTDIEETRWSAEAIQTATNDGIIEGYPDGTFAPEQPLTREQMAVIWERMKRYMAENKE